jgi:hypothetical protein
MRRLSEAGPRNLGLAFTDDGLLIGQTPLIERRDGRFTVRTRDEIERLLKCAYGGEAPIDRLMSGFARVAAALNANDQCWSVTETMECMERGFGAGIPEATGNRILSATADFH